MALKGRRVREMRERTGRCETGEIDGGGKEENGRGVVSGGKETFLGCLGSKMR